MPLRAARRLLTLDALLAGALAGFFALLAHVWLLADILPARRAWWLAAPLTGLLAAVAVALHCRRPVGAPEQAGDWRASLAFPLLALVSTSWLLEPLVRRPWATTGIPNKDLHDGIAVFIADAGRAPWREPGFWRDGWIVNTHDGLMLGYPNVLHALAALLVRVGVPDLAGTWVAASLAVLASAAALFLLLVRSGADRLTASVVAGLLPLSSLRIPLGFVTSIPMAFSFALLLPVLALLDLAAAAGDDAEGRTGHWLRRGPPGRHSSWRRSRTPERPSCWSSAPRRWRRRTCLPGRRERRSSWGERW